MRAGLGEMLLAYLIRYGLMGHIGRFRAPAESSGCFHRGQVVVIESNRGLELGEVLTPCDDRCFPDLVGEAESRERNQSVENGGAGWPSVRRAAGSEDILRAHQLNELRPGRFSMYQRTLEDDGWPWELLDVETLLDGETIVLLYLGPHELDAAALRARFRVVCNVEVLLEPVGIDVSGDQSGAGYAQDGCGSGCGSGGCAGGGCQSSTSQSSCASCGISQWTADRRR
jgi:hypothetical protein